MLARAEWLCEFTIPHEPEEGEEGTVWLGVMPIGWENGWYMMGFVVSLCYVAVLSDLILVCAKFCESPQPNTPCTHHLRHL